MVRQIANQVNKKIKIAFLLLVLTQALHSFEEYIGKLWEVFPPASYLSNAVSDNPENGFLIINIGLFIFGFTYWLILLPKHHLVYTGILWFWITIEIINGLGHPAWTIIRRSYTPGVATAPILLITAIYLARQLLTLDTK